MSPEIGPGTFAYPRSRPRAATEKSQASRASLSPQQTSQAMSPPAISTYLGPDAASQKGSRDFARARATSGSLRQPTPLSPSDIHSILEQEQEAMVNRLSRELSLLRNQTASVASTTSSTSTTVNESFEPLIGPSYVAGPVYPTASRRHRSSSSLSGSYFPVIQNSRHGGRSRRPSFATPQRSQSLISVTSQIPERRREPSAHVTHNSRLYSRRSSVSQRIPSHSSVRTDDTTAQDVDTLLHENEALRRRIRDLELELSIQKKEARTSTG
ncbi:hypothetical protein BJY04DRAFT_70855 [Aspergillus karnatakaensis]|uniref:uncharacterized protein n=1 Tax=Aspergillus karnatakaensis TaxID=1810916 RepID=UPI003CCC94D7